jgi:uncharacterized protein (UPF0248 family)
MERLIGDRAKWGGNKSEIEIGNLFFKSIPVHRILNITEKLNK